MADIAGPLLPRPECIRTVFSMMFSRLLALGLLAMTFACSTEVLPSSDNEDRSSTETHMETQAPLEAPVAAPVATTDEIATGRTLFQSQCASCHGTSVGASAFRTPADFASYVQRNMPPSRPGSLSEADAAAIVAFLKS